MVQNEKKFDAFHSQKPYRIEALADGVFAVAMTLLALDIRIPADELIHTEQGMWQALLLVAPKILTYILTFWIAGFYWTVYTNQFNYIHKADRNLFIISIFYLMVVCLLPFSAAQLSEHLDLKISAGFYCLNILAIVILLTLNWIYAYRNRLTHTDSNLLPAIHKALMKRTRTALIVYVLCFIICFFSSYAAIIIMTILQLYFAFNGFFAKDIKSKNEDTSIVY